MASNAIQLHIKGLIEEVIEYRDQGQWHKLEHMFTENPYIDDKAVTDQEPGKRTTATLLYGWRRVIRDLYYSARHTVGAMRVERTGKKEVEAESEVEARYYAMKGGKRYVHKMVGVYYYTFKKVAGRWKIADMRFQVNKHSIEPVGL